MAGLASRLRVNAHRITSRRARCRRRPRGESNPLGPEAKTPVQGLRERVPALRLPLGHGRVHVGGRRGQQRTSHLTTVHNRHPHPRRAPACRWSAKTRQRSSCSRRSSSNLKAVDGSATQPLVDILQQRPFHCGDPPRLPGGWPRAHGYSRLSKAAPAAWSVEAASPAGRAPSLSVGGPKVGDREDGFFNEPFPPLRLPSTLYGGLAPVPGGHREQRDDIANPNLL